MSAHRQPARQADRRQDIRPGGARLLRRFPVAVVEALAHAIAAAALKHVGAVDGLKVSPRLAGLIEDDRLHSVIDHFVRLLDFTPSELQRSATDTDGHLVPRLRAIKAPLAIFIDGVDEYFNKHVEVLDVSPSVTGELAPDVWYYSQLGLVE